MPQPRVLILRAPGTNCDQETAFAFQRAGAATEAVHVNRLLSEPRLLAQFQLLCLPGGFSYGDDVAAGRILGTRLRQGLGERLAEFKAAGKLILGICNGFQILLKSGVLLDDLPPPPDAAHDIGPRAPATLAGNESGRYEDRWVRLRVAGGRCVFLRGIQSLYLPVAHAEGRFVPRDAATFRALETGGQLVLRYAPLDGGAGPVAYPANPNGAVADVAGVCDATGQVFGLMPHPERYIDRTQHPRWTRESLPDAGDGLAIFQNAVRWFA